MIDQDTEFGARAARRLRDEVVLWMTTVTPGGSPLPRPVWFIWRRRVRRHVQPETFAEAYSVPVRIRFERVDGH